MRAGVGQASTERGEGGVGKSRAGRGGRGGCGLRGARTPAVAVGACFWKPSKRERMGGIKARGGIKIMRLSLAQPGRDGCCVGWDVCVKNMLQKFMIISLIPICISTVFTVFLSIQYEAISGR